MATFRYQALRQDGRSESETIEAPSLSQALERLQHVDVIAIGTVDGASQRFEPQGQRPPNPPRDPTIRVSDTPGGWMLILFGALFAGVALIFIAIGLATLGSNDGPGVFFVLFPLIHLTIGVLAIGTVLRTWWRRRRVYRSGTAAMARVQAVGYNSSTKINGRNPYELVWTFDVDGHRYHDKLSTFNDAAMDLTPGDPMWIVYDSSNPENSAEWPPL